MMGSSLVGSGGGCSRYVSQQTRCLTSTEAIRLIRDGDMGGGMGVGMEVGDEGYYIPIATLSPPE